MADKSKLVMDLGEKLERLRWLLEQPELFITEHFASIINQIDLDAERLINNLWARFDPIDDRALSKKVRIHGYKFFEDLNREFKLIDPPKKVDEANAARTEFVELLHDTEASLYGMLPKTSSSSLVESFSELEKRYEEFSASADLTNLVEMEEAYIQLALDIIKATNELEKRLLNNQTFIYLSRDDANTTTIGSLIHLSEEFLNRDELACFRQPSISSYRLIHETIEASLNASLAVDVNRPFVVTRNFIIISGIIKRRFYFESSTEKIVNFGGYTRPESDLLFDESPDHKIHSRFETGFMDKFLDNSIDAIALENVYFCYLGSKKLSWDLLRNRLRHFEMSNALVSSINELILDHNQLEEFPEQEIIEATELRRLSLVNACLPDTRFSLDFLAPLANLHELQLTLPDAPINFGIFSNLRNLEILKLHSATSLDSRIERPSLRKEHFKQLYTMTSLNDLCLTHFKIESIKNDMLSKFKNLSLFNNQITHTQKGALKTLKYKNYNTRFLQLKQNSIGSTCAPIFQSLSSCKHLDMSYNRIKKLPHGVFAGLINLETLCLNNNSIRHIPCGMFKNLPNLKRLELNDNLIESMKAEFFRTQRRLEYLSLENNKLKSIDYGWFNKSTNGENCCASIFKKHFTHFDWFWLKYLSLKGNQLEKVNLNCFDGLVWLRHLDLSNNRISELNETINRRVLCSLTHLDISNNQLTRISRDAFSESTQLNVIKLSNNKLEALGENFFEPFWSLSQLELQNNNFSVNMSIFLRRRYLEKLDLLGNPDVIFEVGYFISIKSLRCIRVELRRENAESIKRLLQLERYRSFFSVLECFSLVNSSVSCLDAFKFDDRFSKLLELDLRGNKIKIINRDCLSAMPNLRLLSFAENQIETIEDPTIFEDLKSLEDLNLSKNNLKNIHRRLFKGLIKLKTLDLSNNPNLFPIDAGIFRLFNLEKLNLAGNNIASFDLNVLFRACRVLECLDLSNNQLDHKSVNDASMSEITAQNLKELMLANNRLENMHFVRHLYRLEKLDLSENTIDAVTSNGVNLFCRLVKLKYVNLSKNYINSLDINAIFSHLKYQLEFLDLSNNPFNSNKPCQSCTNCYAFIDEFCL